MMFLKFAAVAILALIFALAILASFRGARGALSGFDVKGELWTEDHTIALFVCVLAMIVSGGCIGSLIESML